MTDTDTTLVVPCFRESGRIGGFLPELCTAMDELGRVSVLVVEDGSGLEEQQKMKEFLLPLQERFACLAPPLFLQQNLGKGGAVYSGWKSAMESQWLGFVDADGSCSASEVRRLIERARSLPEDGAATALFASRIKMLGRNVNRLLKRHLVGRIYATLVSELLNIPVYDSQCGLKLIPGAAYRQIQSRLRIEGFAFDVELMTALLDSGCRIEEFPIDWHETPGGKVRLIRDSWRMFWDIMEIKKGR